MYIKKDLPDVEGDAKNSISTFATRYGIMNVASFATAMLTIAYTISMLLPLKFPRNFHPQTLPVGHSLALIYLTHQYFLLNQQKTTVKQFYKAIWNLFYFEYLLYPFV
jgi:homogentisate solanesyltransferase